MECRHIANAGPLCVTGVLIEITMLKHFNYWLTGYGWAEVFFTSDQQSIRFEFSYLSDPLADLIRSLLNLLNQSQNETIVDFYDEPSHYRLTIATRAKTISAGD